MKTDNKENRRTEISRRTFLKSLGLGSVAGGMALAGCSRADNDAASDPKGATTAANVPKSGMTMRRNPKTGEEVSVLGFGCMRLPKLSEGEDAVDQEAVNRLIDYAMEHGVNYYDTSPAYCKGMSEHHVGVALARHPRDKYFIATKLSNFAPETWSREEGIKMYHNSLRELQTDHIDYMLLHAIGMSGRDDLDGMQTLHARYLDNGMLDFLLAEREAGRIHNLGFSYHGDVRCFDYLLSRHDELKWDFVQIQLNYLDWENAARVNPRNTNAEYLYGELEKRGIPVVIMEPLLGGRLSDVPDVVARRFKERDPQGSVASWAFRFAGTPKSVLTVLSGMTYMEHLQDNLRTYMPLKPLNDEETGFLLQTAKIMVEYPTIGCNDCKYCMPCPYGIDIPANLMHYNKCVNEGNMAQPNDPNYAEARRAFLVGYDRSVPRLRQAAHCTGCNQCTPHCPQGIDIPAELQRIDRYAETLRRHRK